MVDGQCRLKPFSHSAIQPFSHSAIQPFSHCADLAVFVATSGTRTKPKGRCRKRSKLNPQLALRSWLMAPAVAFPEKAEASKHGK